MSTQAALMRKLKFTEDDLTYNRRGEVSPRQQARLRALNRRGAIIVGIFGLFALGVVVIAIMAWREGQDSCVYPCMGAASAVFLALVVRGFLRSDPTVGRADSLTGPITATRTERRIDNRPYVQYTLALGGKTFRIKRDVYDLLKGGGTYTIYYEPTSLMIFALEPGPGVRARPSSAGYELTERDRKLIFNAAGILTKSANPDPQQEIAQEKRRESTRQMLRDHPEAVAALVRLIAEQPNNAGFFLVVLDALPDFMLDILFVFVDGRDAALKRAAERCLDHLVETRGAAGLEALAQNGPSERVRKWARIERATL